jgi:predicted transglutaminase-like cysteine proteinase
LRQDLAKMQENERFAKRKLKKAVEEKRNTSIVTYNNHKLVKLTDEVAQMSEQLSNKDEVEGLKKKLKHLSETNESLNKKVKKVNSQKILN